MNISRTARTRRPGFTLIEVLVAAGLCMLIMVVMTQAFAAGIDTFSVLKSTGELQERLAVAGNVLQSDLAATHLENRVGEPTRVSGIRFDKINVPGFEQTAHPPYRGFFRIQQEGISMLEGNDPDGIPSSRAGGLAGNGHILHMAVKLPGTRQDRAFTANLPAANPTLFASSLINLEPLNLKYCSQWAEVAYFLNPTSTGTTAAGGTPLYSLHRRIRVLTASDDTNISWFGNQAISPGMSCYQATTATATTPPLLVAQQKLLNGPGNITVPDFRLGGKTGIRSAAGIDDFAALTAQSSGDDILLSNVISFEIKANWDTISGLPPVAAPTDDPPFYDLPVGLQGRTFDTWSDRPNATRPFNYNGWNTPMIQNPAAPAPPAMIPNPDYRPVPLQIRLKAIQIKLRIYDPKNKLARQITLIQDL